MTVLITISNVFTGRVTITGTKSMSMSRPTHQNVCNEKKSVNMCKLIDKNFPTSFIFAALDVSGEVVSLSDYHAKSLTVSRPL